MVFSVDLSAGAALLTHPSVDECVVVDRTESGTTARVAYLIRLSLVTADELRAHVAALGAPRPDVFVFIARMPYRQSGQVDLERLLERAVPDQALAEAVERRLAGVPGVGACAALVRDTPPPALPWHLDDVLPPAGAGARPAGEAPSADAGGGPTHPAAGGPGVSARPAFADGGPLSMGPGEPAVLGDLLRRAAARPALPTSGLTYVLPDESAVHESYAALLARAEGVLAGLRALGLQPGARVLLLLPAHRDFMAAFWACVLGGLVPVPLATPPGFATSSPALATLLGAWRVTRPAAVIAADPAGALAAAAPPGRSCPVVSIDALDGPTRDRHHESRADDLALLMMTSGSTGEPKAVMLSHRNLVTRTIASRVVNAFSGNDVSVNWMPLDHVAGLIYFHVRDVHLALHQVHLPTSLVVQRPLAWLDALERHRATVTFAPNFAYGLVLDRAADLAARRRDLSALRYVLNGAEAIVARTARRFLEVLAPHGLAASAMRPAWGMSETSSGVTYSDTFRLETTTDDQAFVEVGAPIPSCAMRVVDGDDRATVEGQVGRLQVRGDTVTAGYFDAPEQTRDAFTPDGWFKTGDLGVLQAGRLTVTGREKDVVIVNSVNYYSHAIEAVAESVDGVVPSFAAACAVRRPGADTDALVVFVVSRFDDPAAQANLLRRVRGEVTARIGVNPEHVIPVSSEEIPKTSLGKIQRSELARRLVAGDYAARLRHVDRLLGSPRTVPRWFFRRTWRAKAGAAEAVALAREPVVVFVSDDPVGAEVCRVLSARDARVEVVRPGAGWAYDAASGYRLDPRNLADYERLFAHLAARGIPARHLLHLWQHAAQVAEAVPLDDTQYLGALSLVGIARGLAASGAPTPTRLTVAATHVHHARPGDHVVPGRATAVAIVTSLAQEWPTLVARHVDLGAGEAAVAARLAVEEHLRAGHDREVAYRGGQRLVPRLEDVSFDGPLPGEVPITPGGRYLVTGGAGGIGAHVAALLAERHGATLLIVGRRPLEDGPGAVVHRLREAGADVAYARADVADEAGLSRQVREHEARWGAPLDGVFHLAGGYREGAVVDESAAGFLDLLRPKAGGTEVLHRILAARGGGLFVGWSSVAGVFGGANVGAYAAANAFQHAYVARARDAFPDIAHYCIDWSNWEATGQSEGYRPEAGRARGYLPMRPALALDSLLVALSSGERSLVVGLDRQNRHVRRVLADGDDIFDDIAVFYSAAGPLAPDALLEACDVTDAFGRRARPVVTRLPQLPATESGAVDRPRLAAHGTGDAPSRTEAAPRTAREQRLAVAWRRALSVSTVSVHDNFFDQGGDSLAAVRLAGLVREAFGVQLPVRAIFEAATFADLARAIADAPGAPGAPGPAAPAEAIDAAALLARVDELSEEQVEALLAQLGDTRVSES